MHTLSRDASQTIICTGNQFLKTSHSCVFDKQLNGCLPSERVHSARIKKISSYPAMVPDLSIEMIEETEMRLSASQILREDNPNIFKRYVHILTAIYLT